MSGHRVAGGSKFYSATKYAVTALLEGWRMEVQKPSRYTFMSLWDIYLGLKSFSHFLRFC